MFPRAELKNLAKQQLRGRWGGPVLLTLVIVLLTGAAEIFSFIIPFIGYIAVWLCIGPLEIGILMYYLAFTESGIQVDMSIAFRGFRYFGKCIGMFLWNALFVYLWMLLFIIPGIVKSIAYSQCFFIIADNPNIRVTDALKISMRMTKGYKADLFLMYLSFLGWAILCGLTLGIGYLWLIPYMCTSYTNAYHKLKDNSLASGACTPADFGDFAPVTGSGF